MQNKNIQKYLVCLKNREISDFCVIVQSATFYTVLINLTRSKFDMFISYHLIVTKHEQMSIQN